jgi:hypothetical protein
MDPLEARYDISLKAKYAPVLRVLEKELVPGEGTENQKIVTQIEAKKMTLLKDGKSFVLGEDVDPKRGFIVMQVPNMTQVSNDVVELADDGTTKRVKLYLDQ